MKIKLSGPIGSIERIAGIGGEKLVKISLLLSGDVDARTLDSKKALLEATLTLKPIVADQLKFGTIINVVLTDDALKDQD